MDGNADNHCSSRRRANEIVDLIEQLRLLLRQQFSIAMERLPRVKMRRSTPPRVFILRQNRLATPLIEPRHKLL